MEKRFLVNCHCERVKRAWQSISTCHAEFISASHDNFYGLLRHFVPRNDGKCEAFTLAEVLITLTIIGVIAALTIPNLMRKWSDHADAQKVKEAYSILSNAYKLAIYENGTLNEWQWPSRTTFNPKNAVTSKADMIFFFEQLKPYLKMRKGCDLQKQNCKYENMKNYTLNGLKDNSVGQILPLENGMYFIAGGFWINNQGDMPDGTFRVDINGKQGPNKFGYDIFHFNFLAKGVEPGAAIWKNAYFCKKDNSNTHAGNGGSCAIWVLKHGNMDYKYRDVSAEW